MSNIRDRAIKLLGAGNSQEITATALGVTPSAISQLLADNQFANEVAELRFVNLQAAADRDGKYDELEDNLLAKLKDAMMFMNRPRDILSSIQVINAAKRRGTKVPENNVHVHAQSVTLMLPGAIQQRFIVDQRNQVAVVSAKDGNTDLITMNAKGLDSLIKSKQLNSNSPAAGSGEGNEQHERTSSRAEGELVHSG